MTRATAGSLRRIGVAGPDFSASRNIFGDCLTIDPSDVEDAWKRLDVDTRFIEAGDLPRTLHRALIATLEAGRDEQRR